MTAAGSNPLGRHLQQLIRAGGPIPVSRFMAEALGNPRHGYYATRDPLGAAGDFTTAPEISQMFGELIGLWCADLWQRGGAPAPVRLVELGPGRGTLMADALRAAARAPAFAAAVEIHLVETSPVLRDCQAQALHGRQVRWHDSLAGVPDGPMLVIANEYFDALPVRQLQRTMEGWRERMVGLDGEHLAFMPAPDALPAGALPERFKDVVPGETVELSPARQAAMQELAERLAAQGGAALIIDYGYDDRGPGATLQAVRAHRHVPVLQAPGEADLTAHVDFTALAETARSAGARTWGPQPQGAFLTQLGLEARAEQLKAQAPRRQRRAIAEAAARLSTPGQMGRLFKALAVTDPALPEPAGFAPA